MPSTYPLSLVALERFELPCIQLPFLLLRRQRGYRARCQSFLAVISSSTAPPRASDRWETPLLVRGRKRTSLRSNPCAVNFCVRFTYRPRNQPGTGNFIYLLTVVVDLTSRPKPSASQNVGQKAHPNRAPAASATISGAITTAMTSSTMTAITAPTTVPVFICILLLSRTTIVSHSILSCHYFSIFTANIQKQHLCAQQP